jgi:hypothetical protein
MEPIIVAAIAAVSALGGALVGALVKPWAEDWQAKQRERRERRIADLDRLIDGIRRPGMDPSYLLAAGASIGDEALSASIQRYVDGPAQEEREAARRATVARCGALRSKV